MPSGLPGPGGIGSEPSAQSESGGSHQGFACLRTISKLPSGVGNDGWPVATPNFLTTRMPFFPPAR